ncbi:MAG: hypothetical protein B7C54_04350 [Acidimicrobiales bacterium mtb01]|nr:hypothetical protein [Actinomycetota bacterium]TEX46455.1 MAG: hypothetical protein B7C54_04350 [Acidimicrobiales bacterium mtb01]
MTEALSTQRRIANGVHLLTALGACTGLIALQRIVEGDIRSGLIWLIVCQILDGIDGPIARYYEIDSQSSRIDGRILDLLVDYVTCVVVPTVLLVKMHLVASEFTMLVAGSMLLSSVLWFARSDAETEDHWFRGFPAMWNIVIPSFLILRASETTVLLVTLGFCVLQLTNVEFPHIVRARAMRRLTVTVAVFYFFCFGWLSVTYPNGPGVLRSVILFAPLYMMFLVLWRTWAPHRTIVGRSVV